MLRLPILLAVAILGFASTSALPLFAQVGGIPQYYGGSPLSPWLNLESRGGATMDNYHYFVQPNLQLSNTLQAQQMGIQHNANTVNAVGEAIVSQRAASNAQPLPTGQAAGFMNYRGYFNNMGSVGGFGGGGGAGTSGAMTTPGLGVPGNIGTSPGLNTPNLGGQAGAGALGRGL